MSFGRMYRLNHLPTAAPYRGTETNQVVSQGIRNWNADLWRQIDVVNLKCISTDLLVLRDLIQGYVTVCIVRPTRVYSSIVARVVDRLCWPGGHRLSPSRRRNIQKFCLYDLQYTWIHSAPVLRLSCVTGKVAVNKKGVNKKWYSRQKWGVSLIERSLSKGVKWKIRELELRSGVNSQGTLKQKGVKQMGVNQELGVLVHENVVSRLGLFMKWSEYYRNNKYMNTVMKREEENEGDHAHTRAALELCVILVCQCVENVENDSSLWTVFLSQRCPAGVVETTEPWSSYTPLSLFLC
jgi:hypothetical protein